MRGSQHAEQIGRMAGPFHPGREKVEKGEKKAKQTAGHLRAIAKTDACHYT